MLYAILRPITRIVLQGYYQKIFVHGQENIPRNQPVLLAVNHPSAFTEPCVLATHLDRELHFLIRGDVVNPKVKWFFDQTNQLPIYRFRDGFSSMRQNEKQFSYCFDLLTQSGCIAIFAEGSTKHIKQTRLIQKGAARIAFGALQNRDIEEVWIVPVGVNFESSPRPRSRVAVQVGDPISTRSLYAMYQEDERNGIAMLTDRIYQGLHQQMIHIAENERLEVADDILAMVSNDIQYRPYPVAEYDNRDFFGRLDAIARKINETTKEKWQNIAEMNQRYKDACSASGVRDVGENANLSLPWWVLLSPLGIIGWLFLGPVYLISFSIQRRLNQKPEYMSGFRMAGFLVFVPVFMMIWMIIGAFFIGWWVLSFFILLPIISMVTVLWTDQVIRWFRKYRWRKLPAKMYNELMTMRKELMLEVRGTDAH